MYIMSRKRSSFPVMTLVIILLVVLGGGGFILFQDMNAPEVVLTPKTEYVSPTLPMTVTLTDKSSPVKSVAIAVRLGDRVTPILEKTFEGTAQTQEVSFTLQDAGLKEGPFTLEITARDASYAGFGRGNSVTEVIPLRIDTSPPRITAKTNTGYVSRGGTGCIVYSISKEVSQTGVKVDNFFFPAFRQKNGDYLCFFAFPHTLTTKDYAPKIVAIDLAGNIQINALSAHFMNREFRHDTINISPAFLESKAAEFAEIAPGPMTEIERFLKINGEVRRQNALALLEIGKDTSPDILWQGAFLRLPKAASRAGFADRRTYLWQGQKVDDQTHLGFDLASLAQADIPAANNGRIVFAGYLGIYGNMVVIDHGLGLQSLYSHMSSISVQKGQNVAKGDIIGKTGATGMAGGDHLHFGILISGLEVTPLEWLDAHWIKDNVTDRVKDAGGTAPDIEAAALEAGSAPPPAAKPAARPAAKAKPKPKRATQRR